MLLLLLLGSHVNEYIDLGVSLGEYVLILIVLCACNNNNLILLFCVFSEIFKDEVKYVLCLTTPIDIVLLAVTFTSKRLGMFIIIMFYNET